MVDTDFRNLAQRISRQDGMPALLPVIEKEILHYEILLAMDKARFLEQLTFQGGTCLRLCYSSERYSEDLDFVGGVNFGPDSMRDLREILIGALSRRYKVEVEVVEPKKSRQEVYSWQIKVITAPERPDLPQQRISIEIAAIPAHTRTVRALTVNYSDLPASYGNVLVFCESLEEVCSDKLKAFVTASYIRYRDLWDMRWLAQQPGFNTETLSGLLSQKLNDYDAQDLFSENLSRLQELDAIVNRQEFMDQMRRFLPSTTISETLDRAPFREHLIDTVRSLYQAARVL